VFPKSRKGSVGNSCYGVGLDVVGGKQKGEVPLSGGSCVVEVDA
jgi:hypothetical protein